MINRFYKSAPVTFQYPEIPLQPLMMALESKQKRFDVGYEMSEQLRNQYLQALPQDRAIADKWSSDINTQIDQLVEQYQGDYSQLYRDVRALKSRVGKDLAPGGIGAAIQGNYVAYQKALEEERKRLAKGEITQDQLASFMDYTMREYTGVGEKDPVTGNFNLLNPESVAMYKDADKLLHDSLKNLAAQEGGSEVVRIGNEWVVKKGDKYETISPERVQSAALLTLGSDPQYRNYMSQLAKWQGKDPNEFIGTDMLTRAANMINIYAKDNRWSTMDVKANPYYLQSLRQRGLESLLTQAPAPVQTLPGVTQSTLYDKYRIDVLGDWDKATGRYIPGTYQKTVRGDKISSASPGSNYSNFVENAQSKLPDELQDTFTGIAKNVDKDTKGRGEGAKMQELKKRWDSYIDQIATFTPTDIQIDPTYLQQVAPVWEAKLPYSAGTQWYEVKSDGSLSKDPIKPEKKQKLSNTEGASKVRPNRIVGMGDRIGMSVVGPDGKSYVVTGINDKLVQQLQDVQQLYSPLASGKKGQTVMLGPDNRPYRLESSLDVSSDSPVFKLEITTKDDEGKDVKLPPLKGQQAQDYISMLLQSGAGEFFRDQTIGTNYIRARDDKMIFDNPNLLLNILGQDE